jgi:endonuclease/exonuclease/phosphatase family metal-dependent hydrolase
MYSRRGFLQQTLASGVAVGSLRATLFAADEPPKNHSLRVIAYNILKCTGWPETRPAAKKAVALGQMTDRLAMELALYEPDIVNFSESPDEATVKRIAERLGFHYVRFPSGEDWPGALLSRFEIVDARNAPVVDGSRPKELFTRHWGRAIVRHPAGDIVVHSAHLYPFPDPAIRLREIGEMLKAMRDDLQAGRPMLLMGDLNHRPTPPEYPLWIDAGWTDTFAKAGKGEGLTVRADSPRARIDYVFGAGPLTKNVLESRPLFEGAFRTNPADPESFALSDHLPQMAVLEFKT